MYIRVIEQGAGCRVEGFYLGCYPLIRRVLHRVYGTPRKRGEHPKFIRFRIPGVWLAMGWRFTRCVFLGKDLTAASQAGVERASGKLFETKLLPNDLVGLCPKT